MQIYKMHIIKSISLSYLWAGWYQEFLISLKPTRRLKQLQTRSRLCLRVGFLSAWMFSSLDGTQHTEKLPKTLKTSHSLHRSLSPTSFFVCKYHDITGATFFIKSLENLKTAHLNFKPKFSIILFFHSNKLSVKPKTKKLGMKIKV